MGAAASLSVSDMFHVKPRLLRRQAPGSFVHEFAFTVEPYAGCAFGCSYCFVPAKSPIGRLPGLDSWGGWYDALTRDQVDAELDAHTDEIRGAWLYLAGETDAWQPAERRLTITRHVLTRLVRLDFDRLLLSTRSALVCRDLDVLSEVADRVLVGVSIPTDLDEVRKLVEPTTPSIPRRFETARALREAGIRVRIHVAPLLPHSDAFARTVASGADRVWVDCPDPATPRWGALCDLLGWRDGLDPRTFERFYERVCAVAGDERTGLGRDTFAAGVRAHEAWDVP